MTDRPERVLLVGGAGFIGRALAATLADRGATVDVLDLDPSTELTEERESVDAVRGDVTDYDGLAETFRGRRPDAVVNLAYLLGAETEADPSAALDVNVAGADNVFRAAAETGVDRVVFTSSMAVYGLPETFEGTVTEDSLAPAAYAQYPVMLYAATKQLNEYQARLYDDAYDDLSVVSVRPSTVFGPGREAGYTSWTADVVTEPARGRTATIPHRPEKRFSLIPRFDAVELYAAVALSERVERDAYNTGGHCVTAREVANVVEAELGGEVRCDPGEPGDYPHAADVSHERAREEFGFELTPLGDAIRRFGGEIRSG